MFIQIGVIAQYANSQGRLLLSNKNDAVRVTHIHKQVFEGEADHSNVLLSQCVVLQQVVELCKAFTFSIDC